MFRLASLILLLSLSLGQTAIADPSSDPTPTGRWMTAQHNAVIQIAPCGRYLCGQIIGLLPVKSSGAMPTDWRGHPQCGLTIIQTAATVDASGNPVWKGKVLDPRSGNIYDAQLAMDSQRHLTLHGFIGLPIFGQTQTWTPFSGRTLADCRLASAPAPASANNG